MNVRFFDGGPDGDLGDTLREQSVSRAPQVGFDQIGQQLFPDASMRCLFMGHQVDSSVEALTPL